MWEQMKIISDRIKAGEHLSFLEMAKIMLHYDVDRNNRVAQLRKELESALLQDIEDENEEGGYDSGMSQLERDWQYLSSEYGWIDRDEMASDEPIAALISFINSGYYPPPELLLLLKERYLVYEAAQGEISLEEAFFGPPRRNAGNYAARSKNETSGLSSKIFEGKRQGLSQLEVAENYIDDNNKHVEPESLLRQYRRSKENKRRRLYSDK